MLGHAKNPVAVTVVAVVFYARVASATAVVAARFLVAADLGTNVVSALALVVVMSTRASLFSVHLKIVHLDSVNVATVLSAVVQGDIVLANVM